MKTYSTDTAGNGAAARCGFRAPLRLVTYLAPNLFWFYDFVSRYLAEKLRYRTELSEGTDYANLPVEADVAFVCGLPYVEHTEHGTAHRAAGCPRTERTSL
jgi:hypothetical protein